MSDLDRDDELILAAASMFHAAAMQQLGKLTNPVTGKAERDLLQARFSIDVVNAMLVKTAGMLNEGARRELEQVLFELRMNYLDEERKEAGAQNTDTPPPDPAEAPSHPTSPES